MALVESFVVLLMGVLAVALVGRARTRIRLNRQQLVRRDVCHAWLEVELRRQTELSSHADGLGGRSYPEPTETRTLALVCCGLPVWTRSESIGLPCGSESRFAQLGAADFDRHFTPPFSATAPRRSAIRLLMPA